MDAYLKKSSNCPCCNNDLYIAASGSTRIGYATLYECTVCAYAVQIDVIDPDESGHGEVVANQMGSNIYCPRYWTPGSTRSCICDRSNDCEEKR